MIRRSLRAVALLALTHALVPPRRRCAARVRRRAASEDELARLREEIADLESSLAEDKAKMPVVVVEAPPPRAKPKQGGAAIRDGKVRVDVVLEKLDATQLPSDVDAESEKQKFARVLNLEAMTGEGLKHIDILEARVVTLDADEDLIALLEGVQVDLASEVDFSQFKGATDSLVAALSAVSQSNNGSEWSEADWQQVAEAVEEDQPSSMSQEFDEAEDLIFGIDVQSNLTPELLSYKVNERFYASLNDHWQDWCAVLTERSELGVAPPEADLAAFGAAVEKSSRMAQLEAVSTRDFANEINASAVDKAMTIEGTVLYERAFRRKLKTVAGKNLKERSREDLDELWILLRCATRRGSQSVAFVEQLAGYFFSEVVASDARDVVLEKLREFDLVPSDELDPQKLRDAFIVKVAKYVDFFAGAASLLFAAAFVGFNYLLFNVLVAPLIDWVMGTGGADYIPDFFDK